MRSFIMTVAAAGLMVPAVASAQDRQPPKSQESRQAAEMRRAMQDPDYVFDRIDTNRDGVISKAEFRNAHAKVRQRMSDRRGARMERRQQRAQQRPQ